MKLKELKQLSAGDLTRKLKEMQVELVHLRVQHGAGQLQDTSRLRQLRRAIARVQTLTQNPAVKA
jgi:large subunit ribosomal protein L29